MIVATWNVNGIRAREAQVLDWLATVAPDVACLQEIKASPSDVPASLGALGAYWCHWHGFKGYSGVGLLLRKDRFAQAPSFVHPPFDVGNRIVAAQVGTIVYASIYVPNGNRDYDEKVRFLRALEEFVVDAHARGLQLVLCGDLNVARAEMDVHPRLRKPAEIGQTPAEQAMLEGILSHGLVDLGRRLDPDNDRLFTWWAPWRNLRERNMGWRLDYVLVSEPLTASVVSCTSHREFGTSDHGPVVARFSADAFAATSAPAAADGRSAERPR